MSRKYNIHEINIIKSQAEVGDFIEEDYKSLLEGDASLKVTYKADRYIERYKSYMTKSPSRQEILSSFVRNDIFNLEVSQLHNQLLFLRETLLQKGIITQEELNSMEHVKIAEAWPHLCDNCIQDFAICKPENIKLASDMFKDLTGKLADKVLECDKFERPKQEGIA